MHTHTTDGYTLSLAYSVHTECINIMEASEMKARYIYCTTLAQDCGSAPAENISISRTHTHTSPSGMRNIIIRCVFRIDGVYKYTNLGYQAYNIQLIGFMTVRLHEWMRLLYIYYYLTLI